MTNFYVDELYYVAPDLNNRNYGVTLCITRREIYEGLVKEYPHLKGIIDEEFLCR